MKYSAHISGVSILLISLSSTQAFARDTDEEYLWRNSSGYVGIEPYIGSVTTSVTQPAGMGASAPAAAETQAFSRTRGQLHLHTGFYAAETMFKTLLGFEFRVALGYGGSYTQESKFNFRTDILASYALFRWKKVLPGRIVFAPGFGYDYDGSVPSKYNSRGNLILGGRVVVYPTEKIDARITYDYATSGSGNDVSSTEHQFNLGINYTWFGAAARLQFTRIAFDAVTVNDVIMGGSLGINF